MKRARYAFAAVGAAPALGLLAPAAVAAPATTHAQAGPAKSVKLSHATTPGVSASMSSPAPSPQHTCHSSNAASTRTSSHGHFVFKVAHYGHCVNSEQGKLDRQESGLTLRTRGYSQYGQQVFWNRTSGEFLSNPKTTIFPHFHHCSPVRPHCSSWQPLNWNPVYEICGALVLNGTNTVVYGPECLFP
jgi:hypothetical protein